MPYQERGVQRLEGAVRLHPDVPRFLATRLRAIARTTERDARASAILTLGRNGFPHRRNLQSGVPDSSRVESQRAPVQGDFQSLSVDRRLQLVKDAGVETLRRAAEAQDRVWIKALHADLPCAIQTHPESRAGPPDDPIAGISAATAEIQPAIG